MFNFSFSKKGPLLEIWYLRMLWWEFKMLAETDGQGRWRFLILDLLKWPPEPSRVRRRVQKSFTFLPLSITFCAQPPQSDGQFGNFLFKLMCTSLMLDGSRSKISPLWSRFYDRRYSSYRCDERTLILDQRIPVYSWQCTLYMVEQT